MEQKTKNKWLLPVLIGLLLLLIVGFALWFFFLRDTGYDRYEFDTEAMAGRIRTMTEEEIQEELNRVVEEGMFNISIASAIVFESPDGEGEARIENIEANRYHMQVDIVLDETQEVIYSSKLIRPGYSIEYIKLDKQLEPGEYDVTAVFSAITQEEMQLFGQAAAQIKIYIMDENGNIPRPEPSPTPEPTPESTVEPTETPAPQE